MHGWYGVDLDGIVIAEYKSAEGVARGIGKPNSGSTIRAVCREEPGRKTHAGFKWQYKYIISKGDG